MNRVGFVASVVLAMSLASPIASRAFAQDTGHVWVLDRRLYLIEGNGAYVGTAELIRKALDPEAARNGGRIDLPYYADRQKLEIVEAMTMKADGRVLPVTADKIFDVAPQAAPRVALYSQSRTKSIVFPDLAAGDSIRYVYRVSQFEPLWPGFSWTIAIGQSVRSDHAEYAFDYPTSVRLATENHGIAARVEISEGRIRQVFTWRNDKAVPLEGGSTSTLDWAKRVSISTLGSYAEIGDHYGRLHDRSAQVTPEVAALAAEIVGTTTDRTVQARLLYEWVAKNIRYVAVMIGSGSLTATPAPETISHRYGDCKAHVALLAALLRARGIASEPALVNVSSSRYVLPDVPVASFDHVILYLPEFGLYVEPTSHHSAFGVLPWSLHGKPVLHAVEGNSRTARIAPSRMQDNWSETVTRAVIGADGTITGTTRETANGAMATDLKYSSSGDLDARRAEGQLSYFGTPGRGKWTSPRNDDMSRQATLSAEFTLLDKIDLAAGEGLYPPAGLRFLVRPATWVVGVHDKARLHPFPCHSGRQIERLEVTVPADFKPARLPANRVWQTSIADYRSTYEFRDGVLHVWREFVAHPGGEVCTPDHSAELVGLMSNIRRDYRSVVVFDKAL